MAKKPFHVSSNEIEAAGLRSDYFSPLRSNSGFIKIGLNSEGAKLLNRAAENEIERKQKELEELRKRYSKIEDMKDEVVSRPVSKDEKKQLKKEKKRLKKEKKKLKNMPESSRILMGAIDEYSEKYFKTKEEKKDKEKRKDETEDEKREREKVKAQKEFNRAYDEPLTLLRQTVVEVDKTLADIDLLIKDAKESRQRNKASVLKDLLMAKANLYNNRTTNARSMADIQKNKMDMELKKSKESGEANEKNRNVALIAQMYPQLVSNGKLLSDRSDKDKDVKKDGDKKDKKKKKHDYDDKFDDRATKLIKNGELVFTPHEANIDMEGKYRVAVKKSYKTDDWCFIALDNNGNEIRNFKDKYPGLLPKRKAHNLRFDDEKDIAKSLTTDEVFQLIQVPYL